eukprot:TRINITY_DN2649_c0_g1_i18.p2 TRINITY_DN2649_c0_g1~~TRINITY_DN2649_c0_g1_i18.p2  ORF type:complete len:184 (-),score=2.39 TRINITY_DN2649_c0_g1_i18:166-717(-)
MHFMLCCSCVCSFNLKKLFYVRKYTILIVMLLLKNKCVEDGTYPPYNAMELKNDSQKFNQLIYENYCITDIDIINNSTSYIQNVKSLFVCIVYILIKISLCCYIPGKKQCKEIYWAKKLVEGENLFKRQCLFCLSIDILCKSVRINTSDEQICKNVFKVGILEHIFFVCGEIFWQLAICVQES